MKHGDFTELAKFYGNRPGYSRVVLECLKNHVFNSVGSGRVADIGAGDILKISSLWKPHMWRRWTKKDI